MMNYNKETYIPEKVKTAICQNPELGVCIVYKDNKNGVWNAIQHSANKYAKLRVATIVFGGQVSDFEHDFIILNKDGEVCSTNCDAPVSVDELGIIHIENDRCLIKPLEDVTYPQYVSAKNMDDLNRKIKYLVKAKQAKSPAGFGKYGYPTGNENAGPSF